MVTQLMRAVVTVITAALLGWNFQAQADRPMWEGVWAGKIGSTPVRVCLADNGERFMGSYYELALMRSVPLHGGDSWDEGKKVDADGSASWDEGSLSTTNRPSWIFEHISRNRLSGTRIAHDGRVPIRLTRIRYLPANRDYASFDQLPCYSMAHNGPRFAGRQWITSRQRSVHGRPYTELTLHPPKAFPNVRIKTFALPVKSDAIVRLNHLFAKRLAAPPGKDGWFECIGANLERWGEDGNLSTELHPIEIGRNFVSTEGDEEWDTCGMGDPHTFHALQTYDLAAGAELKLQSWFTSEAFDKDGFMTARLRSVILPMWQPRSQECRSWFDNGDNWGIALTRRGMIFTAADHPIPKECWQLVPVSFERLRPFLTEDGKKNFRRLTS